MAKQAQGFGCRVLRDAVLLPCGPASAPAAERVAVFNRALDHIEQRRRVDAERVDAIDEDRFPPRHHRGIAEAQLPRRALVPAEEPIPIGDVLERAAVMGEGDYAPD